MQLGGYYQLMKANNIKTGKEAYTLKLNEDGTYKFKPVKENIKLLSQVFLSALAINRYKENKK